MEETCFDEFLNEGSVDVRRVEVEGVRLVIHGDVLDFDSVFDVPKPMIEERSVGIDDSSQGTESVLKRD
jgi:hypothetical protein